MIGKVMVLCIAGLMSLSASATRPALAGDDPPAGFTNPVSAIAGLFSRAFTTDGQSGTDRPSGRQTSVILKRQVPIRFGEAPRSWLGGLPMMPESVAWPRAANGAPLHFIAEIDCADLPANLWNGLGPRQGWLLLFVDVLELEDETEGDLVQVLHVDRLGPERQPPGEMSTVRHAMSDFIGYRPVFRPGVPKLWRRWPVDLVVQEYEAADGVPPVSGEELYKAPVSDRGIYAYGVELDRPLTWRGALYFVEGILRIPGMENARLRASVEHLPEQIMAHDLEAPLTSADWRSIEAVAKADGPTPPADTRQTIYTDNALRFAIREDALDAYARNNATDPAIPNDLLDELVTRLRSIYEYRPHRMGGLPNRVQPNGGDVPDGPLLFQMGSDEAMGWSWGDAGALYVVISPEDLRQGRLDRVHAWLEGY